MKILLTGGSGRLGTELQRLQNFSYTPSRREMDITNKKAVHEYIKNKQIDLIVHAAALPNTIEDIGTKSLLYNVNVIGTENLLGIAPILFISSEYVFDGYKGNYNEFSIVNPINYYGLTKVVGEDLMLNNGHKIIRCGRMSLSPWPYQTACYDMYTSGNYIDIMSKEILIAINLYQYLARITHIGINRISIFELAIQSNENVRKISKNELSNKLPSDCSFDINSWKSFKQQYCSSSSEEEQISVKY